MTTARDPSAPGPSDCGVSGGEVTAVGGGVAERIEITPAMIKAFVEAFNFEDRPIPYNTGGRFDIAPLLEEFAPAVIRAILTAAPAGQASGLPVGWVTGLEMAIGIVEARMKRVQNDFYSRAIVPSTWLSIGKQIEADLRKALPAAPDAANPKPPAAVGDFDGDAQAAVNALVFEAQEELERAEQGDDDEYARWADARLTMACKCLVIGKKLAPPPRPRASPPTMPNPKITYRPSDEHGTTIVFADGDRLGFVRQVGRGKWVATDTFLTALRGSMKTKAGAVKALKRRSARAAQGESGETDRG